MTSSFGDSKLHWSKEHMSDLGSEILEEVFKNPKSCRMGDIFYKIQEKINKSAKPLEAKPTKEEIALREERVKNLGFKAN